MMLPSLPNVRYDRCWTVRSPDIPNIGGPKLPLPDAGLSLAEVGYYEET